MSLIPSLFGNNRRGSSSSIFDPFSLNAWDPWSEFQMQFPNTETSSSLVSGAARVDWKETPEAHVFKADIPGLKKEEVKVEVDEDRVLQIRGERTTDKEEKTDTWHRVERSTGKFVRRFRLPENAKMDGITAAMENGVLTVTVPKEEAKNQDVKSIQISG